jgi:hypothetical protein
LVEKVQNAKAEIESLKMEAEKAEREGDYGKSCRDPLWKDQRKRSND